VYYPISLLPSWLVPVAMVLPTTLAASMFQGALGLGYSIEPIISLAILSLQAVILLLLVAFRMRWRET
jgi:ABC-type multidrug transport system permease subunit